MVSDSMLFLMCGMLVVLTLRKPSPFAFFFLLVEQQHDEKVVFATIPFQEEQKEVLRS